MKDDIEWQFPIANVECQRPKDPDASSECWFTRADWIELDSQILQTQAQPCFLEKAQDVDK